MLHYFFLSAVAWMLVEGIQIYVAIVMVFQIERNRKYFYLIGWGEWRMYDAKHPFFVCFVFNSNKTWRISAFTITFCARVQTIDN